MLFGVLFFGNALFLIGGLFLLDKLLREVFLRSGLVQDDCLFVLFWLLFGNGLL